MKLYLEPDFGSNPDQGDGGIRRVVEAQRRWLPSFGVELVSKIEDAEIANIHVRPESESGRWLQKHPEFPLIISQHGAYWLEYEWPNWAIKLNKECMEAIRIADHIIAPSDWVGYSIKRNSLRPTTTIYHGIELEDWPESTSKDDYVLWNKTRVDPVCDPEPVNRLAEMLPKVQFVSTFGREDLENLQITDKLPYEKAKYMVQRAAVYLCTPRETFGIGMLEAMAAGCPVVGWNWGGQKEVIVHGKTGWLSNPGDFEDLSKGVQFCLENREEMGKAARAEVEKNFQWQPIIGKYAKLYQQILKEKTHIGPKVSIVVPAYKLEEYLPECLDSVIGQTAQDWECIVVDDASPDRCGEIAEAYASQEPRIRVIHSPTNTYLAGALNTGVDAAVGRYILPLDADNVLLPTAVATMATALDGARDLHIAYGNVEFLDADGKQWHSGWPVPFNAESQVKRRADRFPPSNLIPSTSMYRKEVWKLTGGYRRRWRTAEDADFWTRATSYGFRAGMVTDADVFIYRNREDSMSNKETQQDWTTWYPWSRGMGAAPAAIDYKDPVPVPSYNPVLISVIIPVGPGHTGLVVDAVDSVDAQTFRFWECIVVNDSSEKLPDLPNWVKVVNLRKHKGVAGARNTGLWHAQAKLFVPLDADDTLEPEALAKMFEVWQQYKGYVYSDWYERWEGEAVKVWNAPDYEAIQLTKNGCLHAVTGLYPVSAGLFDETLPAWEDWDYQLKLASVGICGTRIPEPLFTYRKDTGMRREENYSQFELGKKSILAKWGQYFTGEEELMACKSCGGGGGKKIAAKVQQMKSQGALVVNDESLVLVEYIGGKMGSLNYKGPSGQVYRFSAEEGEQRKYVLQQDLEHFLKFKDFKPVEKETVA